MDIKNFSSLLRNNKLVLFTLKDVQLLLPQYKSGLLALQLHQWASKGWIKRIKRGLYELSFPDPIIIPDFYVANRIYEPSYVSLDTALSFYQIIPEFAAQVTSVTTKPTRKFRNSHGLFTYFTVQPKLYTGYTLMNIENHSIRIAEQEKAVVDRLYAGLRRGETSDLIKERWDRKRLTRLDKKKLMLYASQTGAIQQKIKGLIHAILR